MRLLVTFVLLGSAACAPQRQRTEVVALAEAESLTSSPRVGLDDTLRASITWATTEGIWTVSADHGGDWSAPILVETAYRRPQGLATATHPASGSTVVVWRVKEGPNERIWAGWLRRDGAWLGAQYLGDGSSDSDGDARPHVAVAANGDAVAVWSSKRAIWAVQSPLAGVFEAAQIIGRDETRYGVYSTRVAVSANGNALAAWVQSHDVPGRPFYSLRVVDFERGRGWAAPMTIAGGQYVSYPDLAVDAAGRAYLAWWSSNRVSSYGHVCQIQAGPRCGTVSSFPLAATRTVRVAAVEDGTALAMEMGRMIGREGERALGALRYSSVGGWQSEAVRPMPSDADNIRLATDRRGNGFVLWTHEGALWSSGYSTAQHWDEPIRLTPAGREQGWTVSQSTEYYVAVSTQPDVAVAPSGTAIAAWTEDSDSRFRIVAHRYLRD